MNFIIKHRSKNSFFKIYNNYCFAKISTSSAANDNQAPYCTTGKPTYQPVLQ